VSLPPRSRTHYPIHWTTIPVVVVVVAVAAALSALLANRFLPASNENHSRSRVVVVSLFKLSIARSLARSLYNTTNRPPMKRRVEWNRRRRSLVSFEKKTRRKCTIIRSESHGFIQPSVFASRVALFPRAVRFDAPAARSPIPLLVVPTPCSSCVASSSSSSCVASFLRFALKHRFCSPRNAHQSPAIDSFLVRHLSIDEFAFRLFLFGRATSMIRTGLGKI
jgi:hypothetical protein